MASSVFEEFVFAFEILKANYTYESEETHARTLTDTYTLHTHTHRHTCYFIILSEGSTSFVIGESHPRPQWPLCMHG